MSNYCGISVSFSVLGHGFVTSNLVPRAFLAERGRARNRLRREKTLGTRRSLPTCLTLGLFHSFYLKCHYLLVRAKTSLFQVHAFKDGEHVN